ncbi:hypothetical protein NODU109028_20615 [Nocardioides dubius]|uniref:IPT/TIG domain-containing protein n=1 Tax=Nocardioides dubius TaxID=317019 RepID=A0ABN1TVS2_9ACTN
MNLLPRRRHLGLPLAGLLALAALQGVTATASTAAVCDTDAAVLSASTTPVLPGEQILLSGTGFCPGQRLALKMDYDAYGQLGADADEEVPGASRERILVGVDGTFADEPLTVPRFQSDGKATEAGTHRVHVLDNDPVTTEFATFQTLADYGSAADVSAATAPGTSITVSGTGWVDRAGNASSQVAVVIERADLPGIEATQRLAAFQPHGNAKVWALVPTTAFTATGAFSATIALPDGTTAGAGGSTVAFGGHDYRIRLWSGAQLGNAGDITRNVSLSDAAFSVTAPTTPAPQLIRNTKKPALRGKAKVGKVLKTTKGSWNTTVTVKYQWLRNGKAIKGATKATYKATKKDRNKKIAVKLTATKSGWKSATATTNAVKIKR